MVSLLHLIHVVTDLMQFSGTTCSHVHDVINIIEWQYVYRKWLHGHILLPVNATRWRQRRHFVHSLLILNCEHFLFPRSVTYWHEYYCQLHRLINSTTSYQFLMNVSILHKDPALCVRHTVCQGHWETHHCCGSSCVASSDTNSAKSSQKHNSD